MPNKQVIGFSSQTVCSTGCRVCGNMHTCMTFCGGSWFKCTSIVYWTYQVTLMAAAPLPVLSPTELDHTRDDQGCLHNIIYNIYIYIYRITNGHTFNLRSTPKHAQKVTLLHGSMLAIDMQQVISLCTNMPLSHIIVCISTHSSASHHLLCHCPPSYMELPSTIVGACIVRSVF